MASSSTKTSRTSLLGNFYAAIARRKQGERGSKRSPFNPKTFRRCLSLLLFFGIWQLLCQIKFNFFINFENVPSPVEVVGATVDFVKSNPTKHI